MSSKIVVSPETALFNTMVEHWDAFTGGQFDQADALTVYQAMLDRGAIHTAKAFRELAKLNGYRDVETWPLV